MQMEGQTINGRQWVREEKAHSVLLSRGTLPLGTLLCTLTLEDLSILHLRNFYGDPILQA